MTLCIVRGEKFAESKPVGGNTFRLRANVRRLRVERRVLVSITIHFFNSVRLLSRWPNQMELRPAMERCPARKRLWGVMARRRRRHHRTRLCRHRPRHLKLRKVHLMHIPVRPRSEATPTIRQNLLLRATFRLPPMLPSRRVDTEVVGERVCGNDEPVLPRLWTPIWYNSRKNRLFSYNGNKSGKSHLPGQFFK
jgi:hypothetical protein